MAARENQDGEDFFYPISHFFPGLTVKLLFQIIMGVSTQQSIPSLGLVKYIVL